MFPSLDLGAWSIRTYSLMLVLAMLALAAGIIYRLQQRPDLRAWIPAQKIELMFFLILAGLSGALALGTLPALIQSLMGSGGNPLAGSLRWPGGVIGAALAWVLVARVRRYPIGLGFDAAAPVMPLTLAIVRIGCVGVGCCWGQETDRWAALFLPDVEGFWAWRYPTQLISLGANLLICAALLLWEYLSARSPRLIAWRFDGAIFALYLVLYGSIDFFLCFWRADLPLLWRSLSWNQTYELIGVLLAIFLFARQRWHRKRGSHAL
jgi:phosphatidylglycerol:prolipoprotein diacylglycerol transferase